MGRVESTTAAFLVCRDDRRLSAFALVDVAETMRPLPVQTLQGMPPFLLGVCLIRGLMLPVVDLGRLIGDGASSHASSHTSARAPTRFVTLKLGQRRIAVAVQEVLGVRQLGSDTLAGMPALLQEVGADTVSAISTLDTELLLVLKGAHLVSETVWLALEQEMAQA
ncbi:MAG: chemotaxis protein CheW [Pseudomonadota bacterium]